MRMISYPLFAQAEDNPYLNYLFWVIHDRLATFTQIGEYLMSTLASAERCVALTQEESEFPTVNASVAGAALSALLQRLKVTCNRFGCWQ
jgi:hypothetical protein